MTPSLFGKSKVSAGEPFWTGGLRHGRGKLFRR
jgi:hypothetical protein